MQNIDKYRGCLVGGAAGDALGYAVEFLLESQIAKKYGETGITSFDLRDSKGIISDDTQMTLFTAEGLIRAGRDADTDHIIDCIRQMYICWYSTQHTSYQPTEKPFPSVLLDVPELHALRAPGNTCLTAIQQGAEGTPEAPINNSKGCGGVMRVAPVGLFFAGSDVSMRDSDLIAAKAAALTHGHELGYIPAAALAHIVRIGAENGGVSLKEAVLDSTKAMQDMFGKCKDIGCYTRLMDKAVSLADSSKKDLAAIHALGEGWVAEETLAIAVFCALRHEDSFPAALISSVNHNGDSDSTGAVTGNILGAFKGISAIPLQFQNDLELHGVITRMADALADGILPAL
ncbi:MAG: ADP-ribosylglycohydrolase family protein [Ruminococcus sp.]|nr:ADP-ribosylglycohydrolase family protein [Ruminococcus sp.]